MEGEQDRSVRRVSRREAMQGTGVALGSLVASGTLTDTVLAQSGGPTNEISGIVEDSSGPVQGATVVAVPHDTSLAALATTTASDGTYIFEQSDLHEGENLYHVIARDGSESGPWRGEQNYPFVAAEGPAPIPDSVDYQWQAADFGSPWPSNVGSSDMTVNGMTASTFGNGEDSVAGDGTDDHGLATGPESYGSMETFGIALTLNFVAVGDYQLFAGVQDSNSSALHIRESSGGVTGSIGFFIRDSNGNRIQKYTDSAFDGQRIPLIVNKTGDGTSDIDIYISDMATAESVTDSSNGGFDHTNYSTTVDMGFFARNNDGTIDLHTEMDAGVFEFKNTPYSQSERENFVSRRPEVS